MKTDNMDSRKYKYFNRYYMLRKYFVLIVLYFTSLIHLVFNGLFLKRFTIPLLFSFEVQALNSGIIQLIGIWGGGGIIVSFLIFYISKAQYCLELNNLGIVGTSIINTKYISRSLIIWDCIKNVSLSRDGTYRIEGTDGTKIESVIPLDAKQIESLRLELLKRNYPTT